MSDATDGDRAVVMRTDLQKGIVTDIGTKFLNSYVTLTYTYGFEVDAGDSRLYDQSQVPGWLKEASRVAALRMLASNPAVTAAGVELNVDTLNSQYAALMNRHLRYAPSALLPA